MYQSTANQSQGHQFDAGAPIVDAQGNKLGTLSDEGVQNGYLVVHHGFLMGKNTYAPLSSIIGADANGIQLNLTKDEFDQLDTELPANAPSGVAGSGGQGNTWNIGGSDASLAGADRGPISQRAPLWIRPPALTNEAQAAAPAADIADQRTAATTERAAATPTAQQDEIRVPLREEELVAGKREQEIGRVQLGKEVVEQQQQASVPVTHEEVYVERVPVTEGRGADLGPDAFQEQEIDVPVMGEEVVAAKQGSVAEEVRVRKQPVTEEEQVADTVRKERLNVRRVDDQGNVLGEDGQPIGQYEDETTQAQP